MIQILSKNPDDGTMWLLLIRRRLVNRFKIFKIMLGFENAQYLNEALGADAVKNITAAKGYFAPLMNATLGEEFKEAFDKSVEGTVFASSATISFLRKPQLCSQGSQRLPDYLLPLL